MTHIRQQATAALVIIATALIMPLSALAHKVGLYAYVEDGQVKGQAYFAGGGKAVHSPVLVGDGAGKAYGQATTDGEGNFSLALPQGVTPPLRLTMKASQGHQASYEIPAAELGGPAPANLGNPTGDQPENTPATAAAPAAPAGLDSAELERVVAKVVGEKLAPLNAQVAKLAGEREVSIHDIAAGIGYILGLLGLAAWFRARKQG